jgi:hypothetical protein
MVPLVVIALAGALTIPTVAPAGLGIGQRRRFTLGPVASRSTDRTASAVRRAASPVNV